MSKDLSILLSSGKVKSKSQKIKVSCRKTSISYLVNDDWGLFLRKYSSNPSKIKSKDEVPSNILNV